MGRPFGAETDQAKLAGELLFGKLVHGGEVKVKLKEGEDGPALAFEITHAPPKAPKGGKAKKAETGAE